jgi:hypothetical protein
MPHVDGQFSAHVKIVPKLRASAIGAETDGAGLELGGEFHISLSRPTFLRSHQREDLKRAVKALTKRQPPFSVSFATFSEITNDEQTRMFLIMEVGAGHHEVHRSLMAHRTPA